MARAKLDGNGEGVGYSFAGWEDELVDEIIRADFVGFGGGECGRVARREGANGGESRED